MCANIHYPEGKLTLGACVREHKCESLYLDITVRNVISEPTILCVILSSREEPMYICNSKLD